MNMLSRFTTYLLVCLTALPAGAQQAGAGFYAQAGTGMAGATQGCPGAMTIPSGARDALDDVKQRQKELDEVKSKIRKFESDKAKADADLERAKDNLSDVLDGRWLDVMTSHIDNQNSCSYYKVYPGCSSSSPPAGEKGEAKSCGSSAVKPNQADTWNKICDDSQPGNITPSVACDEEIYAKGTEGRGKSKCISGLQKYEQAAAKVRKLDQQLAVYGEDRLDRATDRVDSAKRRFEDAYSTYQTEGRFCYECASGAPQQGAPESKFDWPTMLIGAAVGTGVAALGYSLEKDRARQNADLGFPTQQTIPAFAYGAPFFLNGFYGAMAGGVSKNGFTCGGGSGGGYAGGGGGYGNGYGANGGGAFGYPPGFNGGLGGPPGGGLFLPGAGFNAGAGLGFGAGLGGPGFGGAGGGFGNPYGGGLGGGFGNPYGNAGLGFGAGLGGPGFGGGGGGFGNPYGGGLGGGFGNPYGNAGLGFGAGLGGPGGGFGSPYGNGAATSYPGMYGGQQGFGQGFGGDAGL